MVDELQYNQQEFDRQWSILSQGISEITPEDEFTKMLKYSLSTGKPLRVKCGIDPTNTDVHIGHMVPYKKMDLIVEAFSKMPNKRLVVIGDGPEMKKIKNKATQNIELLGHVAYEELIKYMQKARAFVYAAEEDFGIVPVEAQACGTPVIAFGKGGVLETVANDYSGTFFYEQTQNAIIESVTEKALDSIGIGGMGGGIGGDLPVGTPDLAPPAGQASLPDTPTTPNF